MSDDRAREQMTPEECAQVIEDCAHRWDEKPTTECSYAAAAYLRQLAALKRENMRLREALEIAKGALHENVVAWLTLSPRRDAAAPSGHAPSPPSSSGLVFEPDEAGRLSAWSCPECKGWGRV
jgi:hypothetical protein